LIEKAFGVIIVPETYQYRPNIGMKNFEKGENSENIS